MYLAYDCNASADGDGHSMYTADINNSFREERGINQYA